MTIQSDSTLQRYPREFGRLATLACLLECLAPKPGNVHRSADFEDVTIYDFQTSAVVLGEVLDEFGEASFGETVLAAVRATNQAVGTNTNLGLILLLTPLVKVCQQLDFTIESKLNPTSINDYLNTLTAEDGRLVYQAINEAKPGGMGSVKSLDVTSHDGPVDLLKAMRLASDSDSIALQYVNGFDALFQTGLRLLNIGRQWFERDEKAIPFVHVAWIAAQGDSLIARKCGTEINAQAKDRAGSCLDLLFEGSSSLLLGPNVPSTPNQQQCERFWQQVGDFDFWLRSDGHRRNPGTTADLIGATLFIDLVSQSMPDRSQSNF
ncbi:MAG: triphosphoribosyl-dephospho-CoA synthase [Planctomycetota bacterium]